MVDTFGVVRILHKISINAFQDQESGCIQALVNGKMLQGVDGLNMPLIYPIGSLIASPKYDNSCLQWLDNQPTSFVNFHCPLDRVTAI